MNNLINQTVLGELLAPVTNALARMHGSQAFTRVLSMADFMTLGVLRQLQGMSTLREQAQSLLHQKQGDALQPPLARSTWLDSSPSAIPAAGRKRNVSTPRRMTSAKPKPGAPARRPSPIRPASPLSPVSWWRCLCTARWGHTALPMRRRCENSTRGKPPTPTEPTVPIEVPPLLLYVQGQPSSAPPLQAPLP